MKSSPVTGKQFKLWRLNQGWQINWLAEKCGVSAAYISKYEEDKAFVPIILLLAAAAVEHKIPILQPPTKGNSQ